MFTNTKIALATALILGSACAALANDIETNPSTAQSIREWREYQGQTQHGYFASPTGQEDSSQSGKKSRNR